MFNKKQTKLLTISFPGHAGEIDNAVYELPNQAALDDAIEAYEHAITRWNNEADVLYATFPEVLEVEWKSRGIRFTEHECYTIVFNPKERGCAV